MRKLGVGRETAAICFAAIVIAVLFSVSTISSRLRLPPWPDSPELPHPPSPATTLIPPHPVITADWEKRSEAGTSEHYVQCDQQKAEVQLDFLLTVDSGFRDYSQVFYFRKSTGLFDFGDYIILGDNGDGVSSSGKGISYGVYSYLLVEDSFVKIETTCYWTLSSGHGHREISVRAPFMKNTVGEGNGYSYRCRWRRVAA